jgi:hypothetical protein
LEPMLLQPSLYDLNNNEKPIPLSISLTERDDWELRPIFFYSRKL